MAGRVTSSGIADMRVWHTSPGPYGKGDAVRDELIGSWCRRRVYGERRDDLTPRRGGAEKRGDRRGKQQQHERVGRRPNGRRLWA